MRGERPWRIEAISDLGISLPGTFEEPVAPVYVDGKLKCTLRGDHIVEEFIAMLNAYVERRYAKVLETVDA